MYFDWPKSWIWRTLEQVVDIFCIWHFQNASKEGFSKFQSIIITASLYLINNKKSFWANIINYCFLNKITGFFMRENSKISKKSANIFYCLSLIQIGSSHTVSKHLLFIWPWLKLQGKRSKKSSNREKREATKLKQHKTKTKLVN